jgi:hypothetical protein
MNAYYTALIVKDYMPHGDVMRLAGPHNADRRQHFMRQMLNRNVPKAQCGVTAIESHIFDTFGLHHTKDTRFGCDAARDHFLKWLLEGV